MLVPEKYVISTHYFRDRIMSETAMDDDLFEELGSMVSDNHIAENATLTTHIQFHKSCCKQ